MPNAFQAFFYVKCKDVGLCQLDMCFALDIFASQIRYALSGLDMLTNVNVKEQNIPFGVLL